MENAGTMAKARGREDKKENGLYFKIQSQNVWKKIFYLIGSTYIMH
jgi:hypothetical protein